jgi:hypothetical protein
MVVDDFRDRNFIGAGDGLGDFVVVDEDEPGGDGLEDVGLGDDADQAAVVGEDGEGVECAVENFLRTSAMRTSAPTVVNSRSMTRSMVEAVRTTQEVVAES